MFTFFGFGGRRKLILTVSSSQTDYDLFVAAGSPVDPVDVEVTIQGATIMKSSSTSIPGFSTGTGWANNTTLKIINNGFIQGTGGKGGKGGDAGNLCPSTNVGGAGTGGGTALELLYGIEMDNTNGDIYGGGGGGGGGTSSGGVFYIDPCFFALAQGGGGGGAGEGQGGSGGLDTGSTCGANNGCTGENDAGGAGSIGGRAGSVGDCPKYIASEGHGGNYATAGTVGLSGGCGAGGGGGAAGKAIELNSNTITWLGGNNASQVKGAVS